MNKEILELFRPEIEAARNEGRNEGKNEVIKEMVLELHQINLPISQIIQVTKLPEEEILKIIT